MIGAAIVCDYRGKMWVADEIDLVGDELLNTAGQILVLSLVLITDRLLHLRKTLKGNPS